MLPSVHGKLTCAGQMFEFHVPRHLNFVNSTLSLSCQHHHCYLVLACGGVHLIWSTMHAEFILVASIILPFLQPLLSNNYFRGTSINR